MSQQSTLREYLLSYCQQTHHDGHAMSHNLSGCDLSGCDLRGLDLSGVDFTDANLTGAHLEGTRLHAATLTRATLANIPVGVLMDAGLSPRILLHHRSEADRHKFSALHFSPVASSLAPLLLSAKECTKICQTLRERCWEDLTDEAAFTVLYPAEPYDPWMARCRPRLILSWALVHRAALGRTETIPFYGRVLPSTLMDEVEETDLVAGIKTSPERVFHTLGIRQILAQSDLQGRDVAYPLSPFGDAEGIVQIKTRRALQLEGGLMTCLRKIRTARKSLCARSATMISGISPMKSMAGNTANGNCMSRSSSSTG